MSLDANGPDNQTFYNHLLPLLSPLTSWPGLTLSPRYVINPLNLGLVDMVGLWQCEGRPARGEEGSGELAIWELMTRTRQ